MTQMMAQIQTRNEKGERENNLTTSIQNQTGGVAACTCSWCSMPMLMVLISMAIMMPRLKYLLSTIPHSFICVLCHSFLHCFLEQHPPCFSAPSCSFLPVSLLLECVPSPSTWSSGSSSALFFAAQTGPTSSESNRAAAHWEQPSFAEVEA